MRSSTAIFLSLFGVVALSPALSRADATDDRKAELQKKKEEAKKKAEERAFERKTTADKTAADKAAADKAAADKAAADKAAADKAAADKAAADKAGTGGASGTGGAAATSGGGAAGKGSGGTAGKGAGGAATKADEKDAPLPAADIEALRKDRPDRRKASVERARKRWGTELLSDPKGSTDLKNHSRRVAYLQRARIVADAKKDKKSVELADLLLTEEDQRHSNAMNALREGALSVGTNK
jgi:hypothetical protein